jgi:6-phosphogluconolactonase
VTAASPDTSVADLAWLFVGTQRSGPGTGLSRAAFDAATGTLSGFELAAVSSDPAFFVVDPTERRLYTCNSGTPGGVSAFALDPATGQLTALNHSVSLGRGPSQLSLDHRSRFVLDANYGGGYVEVIAIEGDGRLGALATRVEHHGHSIDAERQSRPYAHCIQVDPTNRFALVADLGLDQILIYQFDPATGTLTPHRTPHVAVTPGAGPRHLAWHPNDRWLYLIEELSSTVTSFAWDALTGELTRGQTIELLPADFTGDNTAAEILVHVGGRFLYASNRGDDSIVLCHIDEATGRLTLQERVASGGRTPRYMAFDRTHRWLFVANVDSDAVTIFAIDGATGTLTPHGAPHPIPRPYGLALARRGR